jgi:hypothetical protein
MPSEPLSAGGRLQHKEGPQQLPSTEVQSFALPVNVHIEPKPEVVSLSLTHVLPLLVFLNPSQMGREGRLVLVLAFNCLNALVEIEV